MLVALEEQFRFLRGALGLRTVFMAIGDEGGALACRVAGYVERAYAVGPWRRGAERPAPNVVPLVAGWDAFPVPEGSVDVAFSHALLDELDAAALREHLAAVRRALARAGSYFCITGGRHRAAELRRQFLAAGFRSVRFYFGRARLPYLLLRLAGAVFVPLHLQASA